MNFCKSILLFPLLILGFLTYSTSTFAEGDGLYFGAGLGTGDINIDNIDFPGSELIDFDSEAIIATEISVGYEFQNNIGFDLSSGLYDTAEIILLANEQVDLNSLRLGLTYTLPSESGFQFYGRVGINYWQVELTESGFGNPGLEGRVKESDQDIYFQIGAEYRITPKFRFGLAYDYTSTDFGDVDGVKLNFKFFP